jgi:hypothetical protein
MPTPVRCVVELAPAMRWVGGSLHALRCSPLVSTRASSTPLSRVQQICRPQRRCGAARSHAAHPPLRLQKLGWSGHSDPVDQLASLYVSLDGQCARDRGFVSFEPDFKSRAWPWKIGLSSSHQAFCVHVAYIMWPVSCVLGAVGGLDLFGDVGVVVVGDVASGARYRSTFFLCSCWVAFVGCCC